MDPILCRRVLELGARMTVEQLLATEKQIPEQDKDRQEAIRTGILAFYASRDWSQPQEGVAREDAIRYRRSHILWMLKEAPTSVAFNMEPGLFQINLVDDPLADPEGYSAMEKIVLSRTRKDDYYGRRNALLLLGVASPSRVEPLLKDDPWHLGSLCLSVLRGVRATRKGLQTVQGAPLDPEFYKRASEMMQQTRDRKLLGAVRGFKASSDNPSVGEAILLQAASRLAEINPLPRRGLGSVPVGQEIQAAKRLKGDQPIIPPESRNRRIKEIVRLSVILQENGLISDVRFVSGPEELRAEVERAVRTWVYQPTLLDGRPVQVELTIDVNLVP